MNLMNFATVHLDLNRISRTLAGCPWPGEESNQDPGFKDFETGFERFIYGEDDLMVWGFLIILTQNFERCTLDILISINGPDMETLETFGKGFPYDKSFEYLRMDILGFIHTNQPTPLKVSRGEVMVPRKCGDFCPTYRTAVEEFQGDACTRCPIFNCSGSALLNPLEYSSEMLKRYLEWWDPLPGPANQKTKTPQLKKEDQ